MHSRCPICLDFFTPDDVAALPCGHTFHRECLHRWMLRSMTCSTCRYVIRGPEDVIKLHFSFGHNGPISDDHRELARKVDACHEEFKTLCKKMADTLAELNMIRAEVKKTTERMGKMNKDVDNLVDELKKCKRDLEKTQLEKQRLRSEISRLRAESARLREEQDRLQRTMDDLRKPEPLERLLPIRTRPIAFKVAAVRPSTGQALNNPRPTTSNSVQNGAAAVAGAASTSAAQPARPRANQPAPPPPANRRRSGNVIAARNVVSKAKNVAAKK